MKVLAVYDSRVLAYSFEGEVYPCADYVIPPSQLSERDLEFKKRLDGRWITRDGRRIFIRNKGTQSMRSARAERNHKPVTSEDIQKSEEAKKHVSAVLHRQNKTFPTVTTENKEGKLVPHPFDVLGKSPGGKTLAIEVKVFIKNTNDKVTMHPSSLFRKLGWARANNAEGNTHTIVRDLRPKVMTAVSGRHEWYYRKGTGSFRLGPMTKVQSMEHLKDLISGKAKESGWFEEEE